MWADLEKVKPLLSKQGYEPKNPWDIVKIFEEKVANYAGSKYAIALDNCTNAMFLCLRYLKYKGDITIPAKTYISVPFTIMHAGCNPIFVDKEWSGAYRLEPTNVVDGATRFRKDMYEPGTLHCISFHLKKVLKLGKGGMILTDDKAAYEWLQSASKIGRHVDRLYKDDYFDIVGWNMFMPPEQAAKAILLFEELPEINDDAGGSSEYHDLRKHELFGQKIEN
jgi:dTDP-4-amino-4,6-dideoxygalactose transaminase|tara:strand:+ start:3354 stop:4022 length:669 start_codon:yes stop_codon:yes gene_type:complete